MTTAKIGLKRYIKILKEHQDAIKAYESMEFVSNSIIDGVEKAQKRYAAAVNAAHSIDISTIRQAEDEAGIEERFKGFC